MALRYGLLTVLQRYLNDDDRLLHGTGIGFHFGIVRCAGNVVFTQILEPEFALYSGEQFTIIALLRVRFQDREKYWCSSAQDAITIHASLMYWGHSTSAMSQGAGGAITRAGAG